MLFSSVTFLFFFLPITLMLHQLLPWRWKNHLLLAASVLFYASGEPVYILLLAFSAFVGWLHGLYMTRHPRPQRRPGERHLLEFGVFAVL